MSTDPRFFAFDVVPAASLNPSSHNPSSHDPSSHDARSILDNIFDGFLLAVPKKRRSVEKRMSMRFGVKKWAPHGWKMIDPKSNIITCKTCGHFHELEYLCTNCYEKNKEETVIIQEKILKDLGYEIRDKEVRILYSGEERNDEEVRFVEIPKKRPSWFSRNLLSKPASDTTAPGGDIVMTGGVKNPGK